MFQTILVLFWFKNLKFTIFKLRLENRIRDFSKVVFTVNLLDFLKSTFKLLFFNCTKSIP